METLETLLDLYRHMEWADAAVWTALLSCDAGRGDARLRESCYHLHMVQRAFLRLWRGEPRDAPYPRFDEARALMAWGREYFAEAFAFLGAQSPESLAAPLVVPWAARIERRLGRPIETTTLRETALQVVMHSQYHRGQINARLRETGGEPPLVDYIAWVWLGKPAPRWPAVPEARADSGGPA